MKSRTASRIVEDSEQTITCPPRLQHNGQPKT
jgi:hypothetical protein